MHIEIAEVFEAVGGIRTTAYWDGTFPVIEPPDVGEAASTDSLWRLANLVRGLREKAATQLEIGAKAIVEGAIDARVADQPPDVVDVPTATTSVPTTVVAAPIPSSETSNPVTETGTTSSTTTTTSTTSTTTTTLPSTGAAAD